MNLTVANALWSFLGYSAISLVLLFVFTWLYVKFTPYDEIYLISKGKKAPAFSLGGAMVGFTLPILSLSHYSVGVVDFIVWAIVAGIIQVGCFVVLFCIIPLNVDEDNTSVGIFYAFVAICVGAINAFSLIPS